MYMNSNLPPILPNRADSGTYTCEAQNEYGKAESSGDLFVKQGPTFQVGMTYPKNTGHIGLY